MGYKILLVDDDSTLRRFVGEFLQNENFDVLSAGSGPEALRLAYREHPHLVVLDVMMPGMDGWEVTVRLREMADVPIILLTGKTTEADKLRGFRLGVDDYMTKPFSFAELTARIQAVLNRAARRAGTAHHVLPVGELSLDLDRREVRRGDQVIALTPTEFRLLEVLAQTPGSAVSEEKLSEVVWGASRSEDSTAVRRYIWLLRQKIEADPSQPRHVITVRGFGYRLDTD